MLPYEGKRKSGFHRRFWLQAAGNRYSFPYFPRR
jgi:hypothetical protein